MLLLLASLDGLPTRAMTRHLDATLGGPGSRLGTPIWDPVVAQRTGTVFGETS